MATWPTSIHTFVAGAILTAAKLNDMIREPLLVLGDPWTAYSPTWGASGTAPAVGNGVLAGSHRIVGKTCDFRIELTMGSTTTYGTGTYEFSLPITPAWRVHSAVGVATVLDTSAGAVMSRTCTLRGTGVSVRDDAGNAIGLGVPFTWATGDVVLMSGTYETA